MFDLSRRQLVCALAALTVGIAQPAIVNAQTNPPLTKLTLRLDWKPGGQHTPFYLAKARGFYAAEGIDLQIISGSGSSDSVKQLAGGSVDLAVTDGLVLVQAAEQGVPVKSIASYYQRTPIVLISPQAKPVTQPQQLLNGVKLGARRASATYQGLTAMLAASKIDPKKVQLVDIGFGVQPLLLGQVDALMGFTMSDSIEAESAGMKVHEMSIADHGVNAYGLMLAASEKTLSTKRNLVGGFLRATRRAVETTLQDKPAAVQAMASAVSELDLTRELKVLEKATPFWFTQPNDRTTFGAQSLQAWQATVETARRVGLVEQAPDAKQVFVVGLEK